ncbi:hypothetical protein J2129_002757 [Methanofollis sp. W23]|uniref:carboxypeptidase-like regulatory domain-containing protein n=1 Tax=Methanofollis sp. W23 TaxID=2817849 RepID=UPI001AE9C7B5|nr:carboxypeptidase-like regulatory domain-containing protein [Methanofollis sp. W23]MBP2147244.1 hypothetical protein [Methanofollis sp. W23]
MYPTFGTAAWAYVISQGDYDYVYVDPAPDLPNDPDTTYFILSLSPTTAAVYEPIQATLSAAADAPEYAYISWFTDGALYNTYHLNGSTWYEYDQFTGTYSHATTAAAAKTQSLSFPSEGRHTITCRVYDSSLKELASPSATATISGMYIDPKTNVTATGFVYDVTTGTVIEGATVSAAQPAAGTSDSDTTDSAGYFSITPLNPDFPVSFTVSKSGYTSQTTEYTSVPRLSTWAINLYLYPDTPPPANTTSLYGQVYAQGSAQGISGATVAVNNASWSDSTVTTSTGFYEFADVANGQYTLSASAPGHTGITETVVVDGVTQRNVALASSFTLNVTVKDAEAGTILTNSTTVSLTDGQETVTSSGTARFTVGYGSYTVSAAAQGYYPTSTYAFVDRDTKVTLLLTKQAAAAPPSTGNYVPRTVRFHCIDDYGAPMPGVQLSAAYIEISNPDDWLSNLIGVPVGDCANITTATLSGTTGLDGSINFLMIECIRYQIDAFDPVSNTSTTFSIFPKEAEYTIQFRLRDAPAGAQYPSYDLTATEVSPESISLALSYHDPQGVNGTTTLNFWVKDAAGTVLYTESSAPNAAGWINSSYAIDNTHPTTASYGFNATHTQYGTISNYREITLHGTGRLVDLGFEDEFWYQLISVCWIIGLGSLFSGPRVRQGAIIVPLFGGGLPVFLGWLPLALAPIVAALTFLGVFVYMRKSEYKLYR